MCAYTFGDSQVAADRLELLAAVFGGTTGAFLRDLEVAPGVVVDLGCGPGYASSLLLDVLSPERLIAIDASASFTQAAADRLASTAEVLVADVTALPAEVQNADLVFARFLLTHLADPVRALRHWLSRLAPGGMVVVEEVEPITTRDSVLGEYLDLQRHMLRASGHELEIGPFIPDVTERSGVVCRTEVVVLTPPPAIVARMFAMNFTTWRDKPVVTAALSERELDRIERSLLGRASGTEPAGEITWELRHAQIRPRAR